MELVTLNTIIPLALICVLGFTSVKVNLFSKPQIDALSTFCFSLLIPLFLFKSTSQADLTAALSISWFVTFYSSILLCFTIVFVVTRWRALQQQQDDITRSLVNGQAAMKSLAATYSNTVLVAIPVLVGLVGEQVAGQAFVLIAFHSAILFTLVELMVNKVKWSTVLSSLKNPIVMSIAAGLLFNLSGLTLPTLILAPIEQLGLAAIPLALFGLGASMNFLPIKGNRLEAVLLSTVKLVILPATTYFIGQWMELSNQALLILVLLTASPTGVNAFIVATKHQTEEGISATTVVLSTVLCVISISFWSYFLLH